MDNEKVLELIDTIEAAIRELAEVTGADHISAFLFKGRFNIDDYTDLENQKFSVFRKGANNE